MGRSRFGTLFALALTGTLALPGALLTSASLSPAAAQFQDVAALQQQDEPLLLEANELIYDTQTGNAVATGNVFIEYAGYQLFANRVVYEKATDRFFATGGARLEEPEGNIVFAEYVTLSDDMKEGFLRGLRVDTIYRTRLAANSAERSGAVTVFEDAGYTACYTCRRRPERAPTWQIQARRVIYNETDKRLTFEKAQFDLFGQTVAVLPTFSIPDPTVRRSSGFLVPTFVASNLLGAGVRVPYFQTLGPSADVTVAATPLTRQGLFGDIEYRQRLASGNFMVRGTGIYQLDPDAFEEAGGNRKWRGSVTTNGEFYLNPMWRWGWESTVSTDRRYLSDYKQTSGDALTAPTTLFLEGFGERNHFEARMWAFRILQEDYSSGDVLNPPAPFSDVGSKLQGKQAYVHPAIDYEGVYDGAVLSGELAYKFNLTSLSRQETDAFGAMVDGVLTPRFRGVEGTFTRGSAEATWRKQIIAPLGQVLTPYAGLRGDVFFVDNRDHNVDALTEDPVIGRAMPYAGLLYRWPWLIAANWGTQTIEPIAEIIVRPNETYIGDLPNEDAQSVVFDDTNLFGPSRFSGYDRVEGGIRGTVGMRYTVQTYSGAFLSAMVGQTYHLGGRNSYRVPDILDSTGDSGLGSDRSDLVAALTFDTNGGFRVSAKGRFDESTLDLERAEVSASARLGPVSTRMVYAFLAAQPDLGLTDDRSEFHGAASVRVFDRVRVFGQLRYDLEDQDLIRDGMGVAYDDDSMSVSLAYAEDHGGSPDEPVDRTLFFRVGLRTIGDGTIATGLDN
ncbi:LPS-assembly protein LptD [Acuticoccus yangtzensis]|uniref:LPS-assembly protein LptD n=1 Tax=Acuticoccus yangtzensis TaxID=1443441 RepID=UPI00094974A3|nr:LPS-assembly protein LptD [Acuticoccus yangtzensis]